MVEESGGLPFGPGAEGLPLFGEIAEFGLHVRDERAASVHTLRAYLGDLRDLARYMEMIGLDGVRDLDVAVLRGWLARQHALGLSRATLARRTTAVRRFTAHLHRRGVLPDDPGLLLGTPRQVRELPVVPSAEQAQRMLDGVDPDGPVGLRDLAVLETLYATGVRVAELCGLDVDDVDDGRETVRVFGKGGRERTVPIGRPALRAVGDWLRAGRPHLATGAGGPALFLGTRGGRLHPNSARRIVRARTGSADDVPGLGPHGLRHAAATHLLDGGADLRSVQEILGHASLRSTQLYTQVSVERLRSEHRRAHPRGTAPSSDD